jgi:hypothetical protein
MNGDGIAADGKSTAEASARRNGDSEGAGAFGHQFISGCDESVVETGGIRKKIIATGKVGRAQHRGDEGIGFLAGHDDSFPGLDGVSRATGQNDQDSPRESHARMLTALGKMCEGNLE